jgi:16S rRNA (adenine1518-N6/adenine1519-N6)-dimethyltransferase
MLTAAQVKALLAARHLRLRKRLGQHLLMDQRVIQQVVARCGLSPGDTVVEIGPGLGALTEPLARQAGRVLAVEVDARLAALLAERLRHARNVAVICQDILTFPWHRLSNVTVVGAIPYQLSSPILASLCEHRQAIAKAVLLVQEEVAQRLLSAPGTKAYGRLSVLVQWSWQVRSLLVVGRGAFFPSPEVDSRCVELLPREQPPVRPEEKVFFFALVKAAFAHRRKTLANCLNGLTVPQGKRGVTLHGVTRPEVEQALTRLGLAPSVRGEALSLEQFAALAQSLLAVQRLRSPR